ncbi:hypothetical protein WOLCODRAFT_73456 [Wolfiporia cocos MD-104 SS10]|uniref:Uncharacterized protein n=1 Tax=Wolfiporia cocos (strain MD-104) TaxID=742152 RepID=A0A2H3JVZ4_WOLCO|nr:hypothetical protein WOLCODRAFT_73456 [Wolfiporia cocos MD-104 SS10]
MSCAEWKREPTAYDVFFGLALPYKPPRNALAAFAWRRRVWLETTFALSMMQPWEKVLVACFVSLLLGSLVTGMYLYLPHHLSYIHGRAMYYLLGYDAGVSSAWKWSASWMTSGNVSSWAGGVINLNDDL